MKGLKALTLTALAALAAISSSCRAPQERCIGSSGYPAVEWAGGCCSGSCDLVLPDTWGTFCSGQPAEEKKAGSWETVATTGLPVARHEATFVMGDGGKAYLLGGRGKRAVSIYDTATNTWTNAQLPPMEIHHFQAVFASSLIWLPAAWTGGYPNEKNVNNFYTYNTITGEWATRTPLSPSRRRGSAAVAVYQGKLYVAMGNRGGHGEQATSLAWFDEYDIATDTWRQLPDAPVARDHTGGGVVNGKFVIAGGRDGGRKNFFNLNTAAVNSYNFATGKWETGPDFPTPRAGSSYGVNCDGKLMVAGGEGAGKAYKNVDVFDGTSWAPTTYLNTARHGSGLAIGNCNACGNIYIASGSGAQGGSPELQSTEKYSAC